MRQQRYTRLDPEPPHLLCGKQRHLGNLFGVGVAIHMRVADEELSTRQYQHLHRRECLHPSTHADDIADVLQVIRVVPSGSA